jgi:hypothetical protein
LPDNQFISPFDLILSIIYPFEFHENKETAEPKP